MKWIFAPEVGGDAPTDFCFTTPGEPLVPGSKCSSGTPFDSCGCCRAMAGLKSRKGTTVGVIGEMKMPLKQLARADAVRFFGDEIEAKKLSKIAREEAEWYAAIQDDIAKLPNGKRVRFSFNHEPDGSLALTIR